MNDLSQCQKILRDDSHDLVTVHIEEKNDRKGALSDYSITVKDCICVKDVETTACSDILRGYRPPFDATVVEKVRAAGGIIVAKTVQDEFGFGGFCVNVGKGFKIPKNPLDPARSCGGSSGGCAGATVILKGKKHMSIAQSTGGSIASPAAFCGIVGLTPTYGRVSRYGLISYADSLDKIGVMADNVKDAALLLTTISGYDKKDSTSTDVPVQDIALDIPIKGRRIGVLRNMISQCSPGVKELLLKACDWYTAQGAILEEVATPLADEVGISTYYLVAMSEASTNLAKYCGIRYGAHEPLSGTFNDYFSQVRSSHFGDEAKRRILIGTYARMAGFRDAYYLKALKIRARIIAQYKELFRSYDLLLSTDAPMIAPRFEEIEKLTPAQHYSMDQCVAPVNLAGLPHISIPCGISENMPVGLLLIGDHFKESEICSAAYHFERARS